ncbi:uncharacterized protein LOC117179078 isoform X2 [Belonocnema kinseyi]|nr:uncharacterized protein LOC117179078 isoform X2 [Belonocnema kinseyi]
MENESVDPESEIMERLNLLEEKVEAQRASVEKKLKLRVRTINDETITPWKSEIFWKFYYANSCMVCHITARVESCNRCKMIFYCGEKHRKKHWPEHKDFCKVILGMLKETGATTLFDNLKTDDADAWMKTKFDLMLKAESKLGTPLLNYEREMFLFPKTCFVCHESDLSVLKTCNCGISLCKQHKKDERHQKLCDKYHMSFILALEMANIQPYPLLQFEAQDIVKFEESRETIPVHTEITKLPNSMQEFLKTYMKLKGETAREVKARTHHRIQIVSEFISRPLTLLYAIQKLNLMSSAKLMVHVVGATHNEFFLAEYWEILLHWIPALKNMEVAFVGPELKSTYSIFNSVCASCKLRKKYIDSVGLAVTYEDYFNETDKNIRSFQKPDIVIGYNLDLYGNELGIIGLNNWNWEDAFSILKKVNAPFILTAATEKRAKKDQEILCKILKKSVSPLYCEPNPFAGLIPERDFQTEELKYTNNHILIYKGFYEDLSESTEIGELKEQIEAEEKNKIEEVVQFQSKDSVEQNRRFITVGKLEKQIEVEEKQKSEEFVECQGKDFVENKRRFITVGELEKQIEAEEKQISEPIFQFKGKESETAVSDLKKESEPEDKKDSDGFQLKDEATEKDEPKAEYETSSSLEILIKEENRLLKENCLLKEENRQLNSENKKLKQENDRLRAENQLIKDLRSQVKESIKAAMSEKQ